MQVRENLEILECKKMEKDAREDEIELQRSRIMEKGDIVRSLRLLHLDRLENEKKEKLVSYEIARDLRDRRIERSYKLAEELARLKGEEAREELLDKKRKDNKLSPSYTACHNVDLRSRLLEEKVRRDSRSFDVIRGWYSDDTFDKMLSRKSNERNLLHRAGLQNQIIEKRRISRESDESEQRERKINEQTIDLVREEDIRNEERKREIRKRLRAEKEAMFKARDLWRDIRRAAISEENKKIAEIVVEKEVEFKRLTEKKKDTSAMRDATTEKIARKMLDDEIKMREKEDICDELYLERRKIKEAEESLRLAMEKRQRAREILNEMEQHRTAATERRTKERDTEISFARDLYEKQLLLDEEAKRKLEEKRRKNKQYGEDLKITIMNNKIEYAMKLLNKQKDIQDVCAERS